MEDFKIIHTGEIYEYKYFCFAVVSYIVMDGKLFGYKYEDISESKSGLLYFSIQIWRIKYNFLKTLILEKTVFTAGVLNRLKNCVELCQKWNFLKS